jgi:hypothetical protein
MNFFDWVKRLGQWHLSELNQPTTLCGKPMLGNNYANHIMYKYRTKCQDCFNIVDRLEGGADESNRD